MGFEGIEVGVAVFDEAEHAGTEGAIGVFWGPGNEDAGAIDGGELAEALVGARISARGGGAVERGGSLRLLLHEAKQVAFC